MPENTTPNLQELNVGDAVISKDKTRTGEEEFRGGLMDIIVYSDHTKDPFKLGSKIAVIAKAGKLVVTGLMQSRYRFHCYITPTGNRSEETVSEEEIVKFPEKLTVGSLRLDNYCLREHKRVNREEEELQDGCRRRRTTFTPSYIAAFARRCGSRSCAPNISAIASSRTRS